MDTDLAFTDAVAQAELVASGEASPQELVDAAIERIETLNGSLNAVIHERFDAARKEAAAALPDGPFKGVPAVVKDLGAPIKGEPHHLGSRVLKEAGYRSPFDSFIVEKMRAAGLVILGRTNCPEFGTTITTEPLAYGPSRNPWSTDHTTGGSSGGSAAAVSSGMVPLGHANDGGGSIRIPASNCGLVGLKPSRGRVSPGPAPSESAWAGSTIDHAVTRTVRDSARLLDVLAGEMPGDLFVAPRPARPFGDEVGRDPGQLRIGFLDAPANRDFEGHPECAAAVHAAATLLEAAGHHVEDRHPAAFGDSDFQRHFITIVSSAITAEVAGWGEIIGRTIAPHELEPDNEAFFAMGAAIGASDYVRSVLWFEDWRRQMAEFWSSEGFDLLLTPVLAFPPARIGELSEPVTGQMRVIQTLQYTAQVNVSGQPAISLPIYWSKEGLPIGVQLIAGYGREDVLVRIASQLENAASWTDRVPPVHA
ncbi:MAG: amidase [Acidimicrobiales bacterium]